MVRAGKERKSSRKREDSAVAGAQASQGARSASKGSAVAIPLLALRACSRAIERESPPLSFRETLADPKHACGDNQRAEHFTGGDEIAELQHDRHKRHG